VGEGAREDAAISKSAAEQMYDSLSVSERLPADELRAYTRRLLAPIARHAFDTVPFYRDRLAGVFNPDGTVDQDAWLDVPVLARRDLADDFEALKSTAIPAAHGEVKPGTTSGSSGVPVTVLKTALAGKMEQAIMGRFYRWIGLNPRHRLVMIRAAAHPKLRYEVQEEEPWVPAWMAPEDFGTYSRLAYPTKLSEQLAYIQRQGPVYLNTQPSNAMGLVATAGQTGIAGLDVRGIITLGEFVPEQLRIDARRVLGCEIFDTYSANEVATMASQCACGSLHVNAECILLEVLRPDGSPCDEGESGRIVLTTLLNSAMPLMRYDIGDVGYLGGHCDCGLTLPKLTLTVGRLRRLFKFSDGTEIAPIFGMEWFASAFPVVQWQLAQIGPEALELRFSSRADDDALNYEAVTQALREYFRRPVSVSYKRHDDMKVGPGGKIDQFVKENGPALEAAGPGSMQS
jgi:phenylacetate-CoA ligase